MIDRAIVIFKTSYGSVDWWMCDQGYEFDEALAGCAADYLQEIVEVVEGGDDALIILSGVLIGRDHEHDLDGRPDPTWAYPTLTYEKAFRLPMCDIDFRLMDGHSSDIEENKL